MAFFRCFGRASMDQRDEPVPSPVMDEHLNLGVNVLGRKMSVLIPKDAKFPSKAESRYSASTDNQTAFPVIVFEGESEFTKDNVKIGGFTLDGFPPAHKGIANLKLCFEVDANGTLKVTAFDMITCKLMKEITITSDQRRAAKILNAKNRLQNYANAIMKTLSDSRYKEELKGETEKIMKLAKKANELVNRNTTAKMSEYVNRQKELEAVWNPIVIKLYGGASPMLNKAKPDPKASGEPSPLPNEGKPQSCSSPPPPPKAGSVLDVVD